MLLERKKTSRKLVTENQEIKEMQAVLTTETTEYDPNDYDPNDYELRPLTKEEIARASHYSAAEARAMVDLYLSIQKVRVGSRNRESALQRGVDCSAAPEEVTRMKEELFKVEKQAALSLTAYAKSQPLGRWAMTNLGVGPISTAGLLAFIDLHRCTCATYRHLKGKNRAKIPPHDCPGLATAGAIHAYAGLVDREKQPWEKGQRRPWNARLKRLMWLIGDQWRRQVPTQKTDEQLMEDFQEQARLQKKKLTPRQLQKLVDEKRDKATEKMKRLQQEDALYVRLYLERWKRETERNNAGEFAHIAKKKLEEGRYHRSKLTPGQIECWEAGRLQPCGINLRAMRYAECIFLSHYHEVGRKLLGLPVVKPWVLVHGGHSHYIPPPNQHLIGK